MAGDKWDTGGGLVVPNGGASVSVTGMATAQVAMRRYQGKGCQVLPKREEVVWARARRARTTGLRVARSTASASEPL